MYHYYKVLPTIHVYYFREERLKQEEPFIINAFTLIKKMLDLSYPPSKYTAGLVDEVCLMRMLYTFKMFCFWTQCMALAWCVLVSQNRK